MLHRSLFLLTLLTLTACASQPSSPKENEDPTQTVSATPNAQPADATHGEVRSLSIGALSGANGTLANGVATSYFFEDNGTIIGLQLNIAAAEKGTTYSAWAENDKKDRVALGTLESVMNDVRHSMRFDTTKDLSSYTHIYVTKQQTGQGSIPGEIVATGTLKATGR